MGYQTPRTDLEGSGASDGSLAEENRTPQQPAWVPCRARHRDGDHRGETCPAARTSGASAILRRLHSPEESIRRHGPRQMPRHPGTSRGGSTDAPTDPQLQGYSKKCLPCEGELRPSFQGRSWSDPGGALVGKTIQYYCRRSGPRVDDMRETLDDSDSKLAARIEALFAIFYFDDGYITSKDAEFLQEALDILVETFKHVGLATNTKKMQAMVCTPGRIRVQLPMDSYQCLREGVAAGEEGK